MVINKSFNRLSHFLSQGVLIETLLNSSQTVYFCENSRLPKDFIITLLSLKALGQINILTVSESDYYDSLIQSMSHAYMDEPTGKTLQNTTGETGT